MTVFAVSDFNVGNAPVLVFQVLRLHSNAGIREYLAILANRGVAADDSTLLHDGARTDLDIRADIGVGANLDTFPELGVLVDDCGRVNDH